MAVDMKKDDAIGRIEDYCLENPKAHLTVLFPEGDSYVCAYETGEWEDNGEWNPGEDTRNLSGFEEWYEITLRVLEACAKGPNWDDRYHFIVISCKHMPCLVRSGNTVLYEE